MTQEQGSRTLADAEQDAEAAQPGRKWMGLMKRSRANVVGPSPGAFFHQPPTGRMGGLCHHRQHARGPSENSAPLRGGSVQCAQKDGDSHEIDYTRVGFETRSFFPCVRAGLPEDIVYHHNRQTLFPRRNDERPRRICTDRGVLPILLGAGRVSWMNATATATVQAVEG